MLSLRSHEEDLREAAVLDYYVAGYWYCTVYTLLVHACMLVIKIIFFNGIIRFARENKFTEEQSSAIFTLLHTLLNGLKGMGFSCVQQIVFLENSHLLCKEIAL